jgi:hypothetical protein
MAGNEEEIRQRIIIDGAAGALKELQMLGDEGAAAIEKIKAAGNGDFARGLSQSTPAWNKFIDDMTKAEIAASAIQPSLKKTQAELRKIAQASAGTGRVASDFNETAVAADGLNQTVRGLARTFRGIGRVTQIPGITFLGRDLRALSANFAAVIGPAVIGGFGLLADSAAKATQPFQELAFAAGQTPQALQLAGTAALAFGGDVTKLGTALSKLPALAKETATQEKAIADASRNVSAVIDKGNKSFDEHAKQIKQAALSYETFRLQMQLGLDPVTGLREQISDLSKSFKEGKITQEDFTKQNIKLNNQLTLAQRQQRQEQAELEQRIRDANQAFADQAEAQLADERAAVSAKRALEESANAFVKLGVSSQQLKSLKPGEAFELIAQKLEPMEKGFKRNQLAIEIFGESARQFITELDKGTGSVAKWVAESQKIAPAFNDADNAIGNNFLTSLGKLEAAMGSLKDAFGLALAPAFTEFLNGLAQIFVDIRPSIVEFGKTISPFLSELLQGFLVVLRLVGSALGVLRDAFTIAADQFNKLFGSEVLSAGKIFLGLILLLAVAFAPLSTAILLIVIAIGAIAEAVKNVDFKKLGTNALAAFDKVKQTIVQFIADFFTVVQDLANKAIDPVVKFFNDAWESIKTIFNDGTTFVSDSFNTALGFITGLWDQFKQYLLSWVGTVVEFFRPLIETIKKISAFFSSEAPGNNGSATAGAFASGGNVRGPGTGTSDSILAWLSNGEFVMRMKAVQKYGLGFMQAINSGKLDLLSLAAFSLGGLAEAMGPSFGPFNLPAYADGGAVNFPGAGLKPVAINFEGTRFDAFMTDAAITQISKKSVRDRSKRAGRSPSWVGG